MKFKTTINIKNQQEHSIGYSSQILLLGSCFSKNISEKFQYFKFQSVTNPFGIIFHPQGIEQFVQNAALHYEYTENDLYFHNDRWQCFDAHSSLSSANKEELIKNLNKGIAVTGHQLEHASHIVITFGTAWVYRFIENQKIVVNCHKIPQKKFKKELLSVEEVSKSMQNIIKWVHQKNPKAVILFTVSPVRHLKDGFVENMQSKSHLLAGVHQVVQNNSNVFYFPSFEIMMDDLRDYRFYTSDLLHPNQMAVDYIWEKFTEAWCSENTLSIIQEVESIQKGLLHRPFDETSEAHQQFLKKLSAKKHRLTQQFPHIQF